MKILAIFVVLLICNCLSVTANADYFYEHVCHDGWCTPFIIYRPFDKTTDDFESLHDLDVYFEKRKNYIDDKYERTLASSRALGHNFVADAIERNGQTEMRELTDKFNEVKQELMKRQKMSQSTTCGLFIVGLSVTLALAYRFAPKAPRFYLKSCIQ